MKATKRVRQTKTGRNQGAGNCAGGWFQAIHLSTAQEHNLVGWVRNTSGSVEIEVEGRREYIDQFLAALKPKSSSPGIHRAGNL